MTITQSFSQFNFISIPQSQSTKTNHRLAGLRRFAIAITFLNILGHTFLGFEQSWAQPFVSLLAAYLMELGLETLDSFSCRKATRFWGSLSKLIDFLLPAHITGLAVAMLLYANERLFPIAFAAAVAIASKYLFRVAMGNKLRHFLNPSNFGISVTLLIFPWIGIAPPYQFTENLYGYADWIFPIIIVCTGTFLNGRFTHKLPLIMGWVGGFFLQAAIRSYYFDTPLMAALLPMTGVAFVLFTFYMISDPGTTPISTKNQIMFGLSVAMMYGVLMLFHVVFGMFFGLTIVCLIRGLIYYIKPIINSKKSSFQSLSIN
ncbi:enediyne biosynthesis protein UnbU [Crocosphaera watsonii]|uniref:enediyne biosynthesis protein UnbU n=1 Tax=Crocosphaera watsonii TaxID=263511 RepID=UPI0030D76DCB